MTATTENQLIEQSVPGKNSHPVLAAKTLYQGTLVYTVLASGYATDDDAAGANYFAGVAVSECDNSAGASGDLNVEVLTVADVVLTGAGFTAADIGKKVHGVDNNTVQLSATSATLVGKIVEVVSATRVRVRLEVGIAS